MENQNITLTKAIHQNFSQNEFEKCVELADESVQIVAHAFGMTLNGREAFRSFAPTTANISQENNNANRYR